MRYIFLMFFFGLHACCIGQKLSGQWTGDFGSNSEFSAQKTEYILEIEVNGNDIKGFSYTYFTLGNKRCFVICKLAGSFDKNSKSMVIAEIEKIKSNTPPDFRDCLQKHELTYFKAAGKEILSGKWTPVDPKSGCGTGLTILERKPIVKTNPPTPKNEQLSKISSSQQNDINTSSGTKDAKTKNSDTPNFSDSKKNESAIMQNKHAERNINTIEQKSPIDGNSKNNLLQSLQLKTKFNERSFQILKTIELENAQIKVELYDNGQIDGDTISLYFNGKLLVSQKRLTTSPISLNINIDDKRDYCELVMYAENLGSIPPNTALMIVTDGDKRYELNISSSEMTNGTVRFKLKK